MKLNMDTSMRRSVKGPRLKNWCSLLTSHLQYTRNWPNVEKAPTIFSYFRLQLSTWRYTNVCETHLRDITAFWVEAKYLVS